MQGIDVISGRSCSVVVMFVNVIINRLFLWRCSGARFCGRGFWIVVVEAALVVVGGLEAFNALSNRVELVPHRSGRRR